MVEELPNHLKVPINLTTRFCLRNFNNIRTEKILEQKLYISSAEEPFSLREKCKFLTKIYPVLRICRKFVSTSLKSLQIEPLSAVLFASHMLNFRTNLMLLKFLRQNLALKKYAF